MRHLALTLGLAVASSSPARAGDAEHPTVVELFQSQGCSSCPPANANVNALIGRADLLPLSFAVTYWDRLGWKDTFAQPAFTQRQRDYASIGGRRGLYTPQVVVNGRFAIVGNDGAELERTIRRQDRGSGGPALAVAAGRVTIGSAAATRPATVWLVYYDPRLNNVPIRAGENGGKTLPHRNIVRVLQRLGTWKGAALTLAAPPSPDPAWRGAILVQEGTGGPIVAARRI
jgi:hypothetical protein